ncbi:TetR/AcrR family transcriptional regulator [Streptomyces sp. CT34]|uniref:TetR/AcrR family transcriptional regulator n=1 Tax=Streptomyces sp. CT34 TaxID=1553907 RepID=UPI00099CA57B|nr:TetR/AcrR family transcriptional regulator [Streptomyces sp. CT34]
MIVAATLPLVAEFGAAVTTSQIARAAGIGEATIFRAFKDKDEVLDACVAEAVGTEHVLRELASIPLDEPLDVRLTDAAEALCAHMERMGAVVGSLYASGYRRGRDRTPDGGPGERPPQDSRAESLAALREAVAELIEADRDALRLSPERVASAFMGLLFTRRTAPVNEPDAQLTPQELVSVLLHGTLKSPGGN